MKTNFTHCCFAFGLTLAMLYCSGCSHVPAQPSATPTAPPAVTSEEIKVAPPSSVAEEKIEANVEEKVDLLTGKITIFILSFI